MTITREEAEQVWKEEYNIHDTDFPESEVKELFVAELLSNKDFDTIEEVKQYYSSQLFNECVVKWELKDCELSDGYDGMDDNSAD